MQPRPGQDCGTAQPFQQAGFTDLAFVQAGFEGQSAFLEQAAKPLLESCGLPADRRTRLKR